MSELRQRDPRVECPAFLAFVRRHRCCVCGAPSPSQAAHIAMAKPEIGKRYTGMSEKAHDRYATPLCADCHHRQHNGRGEREFWKAAVLDPFEIAATLWAQFQRDRARSPEVRKEIVKRAKRIKRRRERGPKRKIPSRPFQRGKQ